MEEILRTEHATLQNIYGFPEFSNTLEFLTMLAVSSGRLLKVAPTHTSHALERDFDMLPNRVAPRALCPPRDKR